MQLVKPRLKKLLIVAVAALAAALIGEHIYASAAFTASQRKLAETVKFSTYLPDYMPEGYKLVQLKFSTRPNTSQPDLTVVYEKNAIRLTIYEYDLGVARAAFKDCGPVNTQSESTAGCRLEGETPRGVGVYQDGTPTAGPYHDYITLGNTRLSLSPATDAISEGVKIFSSLNQVSPNQLPFRR